MEHLGRGTLARPLFSAAAAAAAGSALGASGALPSNGARVLCLLVPIAWIGSARWRRSSAPRWIVGGRTPACLLALLVGGFALRASPDPPAASERGVASEEPSGASVATWRSVGSARDAERGRLEPGDTSVLVPPGSLEDGDTIVGLFGTAPSSWARGPEPGPARRRGIEHPPIECDSDELVRLAPARGGAGDLVAAPLERARERLLDRVGALRDAETRGLVAGLLFGDLTELPPGIADLFVRTGTFHVLAISGLQVALVAVFIALPLAELLALGVRAALRGLEKLCALRFLGGARDARGARESSLARESWLAKLRAFARVHGAGGFRAALLLLFVPIAGAGPPVTRSALAWTLGSLAGSLPASVPFARPSDGRDARTAHFMPRSSDPLSLWSLALVCECLAHPRAALSLSVQLSYAATLGLIVCTGTIVGRLRALVHGRAGVPSTAATLPHSFARALARKTEAAACAAVGASLAAVLATAPFAWSSFGEWSPAGILATPAIAPAVAWLLIAGWLWLASPALVPQVVLEVPARALLSALELFDGLPGTPTLLPPRAFALIAAAAALALFALSRPNDRRAARARAIAGRVGALSFAASVLPWCLAPSGLEVHALDVGNGTAVLLRAPGGEVWVFDAGSRDRPDVEREALGPLLRRIEAGRLGVVLSHADRDHDGALPWLVERLPPRRWVGALPAHLDVRLPHGADRADLEEGRLELGGLSARGPLRLELSRALPSEDNEGSRTLEVTFLGQRLVLCGDAEAEGLSAWLRARPPRGRTRLLLLPHHGSDTEHLAALLRTLAPEEVWITATGTPDVVRELERRAIPSRCTGSDGPLRLELPWSATSAGHGTEPAETAPP